MLSPAFIRSSETSSSGITSLCSHSACQQGTGGLALPIHRAEEY